MNRLIQVIKALKRAGFIFDRHAKGSHEIYYNPVTKSRTTVPNHPGSTLPQGTLRAIIKQAGLTREKFLRLLKKK
ncbi:MAG: type II toxin-antitoxin system HicA family toxin [Candidatus Hydrothermarchaeales archaeon]